MGDYVNDECLKRYERLCRGVSMALFAAAQVPPLLLGFLLQNPWIVLGALVHFLSLDLFFELDKRVERRLRRRGVQACYR